MSSTATLSARTALQIPGWLPAVLLIAVTAIAGQLLGAMGRPLFLLGSLVAGWYAYSRSPGAHLQAALALFSFAPFLRRLVDSSAGFDPSGVMIAGPFLALLAPLPELRQLTLPGRPPGHGLAPFLVFGFCVLYALTLTIAEGAWAAAANGALKWGAPLLYALALYQRAPDAYRLVRDAAAALAVIMPVTGIYGIYQYVDPPLWDRYWLIQAAITSPANPRRMKCGYSVRCMLRPPLRRSLRLACSWCTSFARAGERASRWCRPWWRCLYPSTGRLGCRLRRASCFACYSR